MKVKNLLLGLSLVLLVSCSPPNRAPDYWPTGEWRTSTPEAQGIDSALLADAIEPLIADPGAGLHSLILIRNGYIVAEWYAPGHDADRLHALHSATKSFTSTLIGTAVGKKLLTVDQKVLSFFPGESFENPSEWKEAVTVRDLLTMGSGFDWKENIYDATFTDDFGASLASENWARYILGRKVITKPGVVFNYNTGNSHLLSVILSKVAGQPVLDYARMNLFGPLGIRDFVWVTDPQGIPAGGVGLQLRPRDMAKLGLLYLNDGVWDGKRLLPKGWVREASRNHYPSGETAYGYQFWVHPYIYQATGAGDQFIFIMPRWNTVLVTTAAADYTLRHQWGKDWENFWNGSQKALMSRNKPLPENPAAYERLTVMLAGYSAEQTIPLEVPAALKPLVGQTILLDKNPARLVSFTLLKLNENGVEFALKTLDPLDGAEKRAVFSTGMDHLYRDNGYAGYPLSLEYFRPVLKWIYPDTEAEQLYLRVAESKGSDLLIEGFTPGAIVRFRLGLSLTDEGPVVRLGEGVSLMWNIRGRL